MHTCEEKTRLFERFKEVDIPAPPFFCAVIRQKAAKGKVYYTKAN